MALLEINSQGQYSQEVSNLRLKKGSDIVSNKTLSQPVFKNMSQLRESREEYETIF